MMERHMRDRVRARGGEGGAAERGPVRPRSAPDLAVVRALAECGGLAAAFCGLAGPDRGPRPASPAGRLAGEIARAGFPAA